MTLARDRLDANPLEEIRKLRSSRTPVLTAILAQWAMNDKPRTLSFGCHLGS